MAQAVNRVPMTVAGERALREELDHLRRVERPGLSQAIAEARAHGDLKENAEYHAAREQQGLVEGRIRDIESKLSQAQVIDVTGIPASDRVIFGATVTLIKVETGEQMVYQIVGDDEADVKVGKISVNSPIARGVVGKEVGDIADIQTPSGVAEFEIDQVEYG